MLPPLIIYEKSYPSGNYIENGPIEVLYESKLVYMDKELFWKWLEKNLVPKTKHLRKLLLIIDGHGSHTAFDVIDLLTENNINLLCLFAPSHYTPIATARCIDISAIEKLFF